MDDLERVVLEGARDHRPAFTFFTTREKMLAWQRVRDRGLIVPADATFTLTEPGHAALSSESPK